MMGPGGMVAMQALPGGGMVPGGMAVALNAQGVPVMAPAAAAAAAAAAANPLTVASSLFAGGAVPGHLAPVWFVLGAAPEPQGAPKAQGPIEPADMLAMFRDGRLQPSSLVCAAHRPAPGQAPPPPPPAGAFQPLQALLAGASSELFTQQVNAHMAAAAAGQVAPGQEAMLAGGGQMPALMIQMPGQPGGPALMAVPAAMGMQQLHQMQVQQVQAAGGLMVPYVQQGGMLVPQHMVPAAAAAAMQQQQAQAQAQQAPAKPPPMPRVVPSSSEHRWVACAHLNALHCCCRRSMAAGRALTAHRLPRRRIHAQAEARRQQRLAARAAARADPERAAAAAACRLKPITHRQVHSVVALVLDALLGVQQ